MKNDLIINHINEKLVNTELETDPWTYKFIEKIFPDDFYQEILQNIPSSEYYKSRVTIDKNAKKSNYNSERYVFPITQENLLTLNDDEKKFWHNLMLMICSNQILNTVMTIFKTALDTRMNNLSKIEKDKLGLQNYKIVKKAEIVKDFKKYHLGAHTDNYNKFITFLFYFRKIPNTLNHCFWISVVRLINKLNIYILYFNFINCSSSINFRKFNFFLKNKISINLILNTKC